ncbi:hypothetical protein AB751O23_CM_00030 [Chlamydiales bacterium SCGC AB-751-O23]|jgi:hypothetical protein|nr:hypothetical protein AB751O23_CM_00030 [Chlamydiales bacterium SCGC AB-751-O23]
MAGPPQFPYPYPRNFWSPPSSPPHRNFHSSQLPISPTPAPPLFYPLSPLPPRDFRVREVAQLFLNGKKEEGLNCLFSTTPMVDYSRFYYYFSSMVRVRKLPTHIINYLPECITNALIPTYLPLLPLGLKLESALNQALQGNLLKASQISYYEMTRLLKVPYQDACPFPFHVGIISALSRTMSACFIFSQPEEKERNSKAMELLLSEAKAFSPCHPYRLYFCSIYIEYINTLLWTSDPSFRNEVEKLGSFFPENPFLNYFKSCLSSSSYKEKKELLEPFQGNSIQAKLALIRLYENPYSPYFNPLYAAGLYLQLYHATEDYSFCLLSFRARSINLLSQNPSMAFEKQPLPELPNEEMTLQESGLLMEHYGLMLQERVRERPSIKQVHNFTCRKLFEELQKYKSIISKSPKNFPENTCIELPIINLENLMGIGNESYHLRTRVPPIRSLLTFGIETKFSI